MNYTQKTCVKPYSKVRNNTYDHLASKNVSPKSRLTYSVLGTYLDYDSSNARATYDQLLEGCGFGSYQTVSRCLKELDDKGLIIKTGRSRYKLTYGIYMGIIENENKTEKTIPSSPSQKKANISVSANIAHSTNTTPSVVKENPPIYSTILNNNKLRKSRHDRLPDVRETMRSDDVSKLKFKQDSAFRTTSKQALSRLIGKYGLNLLQDRISKLDGCYSAGDLRKSPERMLYTAIREGDNWKYETKTGEVITLREPSCEQSRESIQLDRNIKKLTSLTHSEREVFKKLNPLLVQRFKNEIAKETPKAIDVPFWLEILVNNKVADYTKGVYHAPTNTDSRQRVQNINIRGRSK